MKPGDVVRLTKAARKFLNCPKERDNNVTSVIDLIDARDGSTHLTTDLGGCRWWNLGDLEPANQVSV